VAQQRLEAIAERLTEMVQDRLVGLVALVAAVAVTAEAVLAGGGGKAEKIYDLRSRTARDL